MHNTFTYLPISSLLATARLARSGAQATPEAPPAEEGGGEAPAEGGGEFEF